MRGESVHFLSRESLFKDLCILYFLLDRDMIAMAINNRDVFKMPRMAKAEYDRLVEDQYICRIAFKGGLYPHIAPFLYVFDGRFMYFLSSNYGRKVQYFRDNPLVTVEIEHYSPDLTHFSFVSLPGRLVELEDDEKKRAVRERFVGLIKSRSLSPNVMSALGHSPEEPVEALLQGGKNTVWKLTEVRVEEIMGLRGDGWRGQEDKTN